MSAFSLGLYYHLDYMIKKYNIKKNYIIYTSNVPLPHVYKKLYVIHRQGFGILFRSVNFRCNSSKIISALLRGLQKMAASKPISLLY